MKTYLFILSLWYLEFSKISGSILPRDDPNCGACPKYDRDAINVHLVAHSHNEVGWLKNVEDYYYDDVQYSLTSIIPTLMQKSDRRFVQVEMAYFAKWWEQQDLIMRQNVKNLVNNGQLEIVNGGWTINDEGTSHYQSIIDQYTLGLRFIEKNFGKCGRPKVAWQIDTLGHSKEQASISAQMGFEAIFFDRLDYRDIKRREEEKTTEILWRTSRNLGNTSDIFASIIYKGYKSPDGFCFDITCSDKPMIGEESSPLYNYKIQVESFAEFVKEQSSKYPTNNILITMGEDFSYKSALKNFINMDRLIKGFELFPQNISGTPLRVFYSSPSCYVKSIHESIENSDSTLEIETNDFFPLVEFNNDKEEYYTGYFSSRPNSKRFERYINNYLQVAKQFGALALPLHENGCGAIYELRKAMGIMQHHHAITGTEKQNVADNYHYLLDKPLAEIDLMLDFRISSIISDGESAPFNFKSCFLLNISQCPESLSDKFYVAVYNPISRPVSAPLHIPIRWEEYAVFNSDNIEVPSQIYVPPFDFSYADENIEINIHTLSFLAKDLPPLGMKVYRIEKIEDSQKVHEHHQHPKFSCGDNDGKIGYDKTFVELDVTSGLLKKIHMNYVDLDISQELLYYKSEKGSGAYTFNPSSADLHKISDDQPVRNRRICGDVFDGIVQEFGDWARQVIKVYKDDQSYIEIDWVIGPLDVSDGFGKEVVSKFITPMVTDKTWFTDSNGRELINRTRKDTKNIAENYFPINTRIVLKDFEKNLELAIITDRTQGGSSLQDGHLEIMLHRACVDKDVWGEALNEQQFGQGLVVKGQHYLVLGKSELEDGKKLGAVQREIGLKKQLAPWPFFTKSQNLDNSHMNFMKKPLPESVNLLTLETWTHDTILIRLEHILEKDDVRSMDLNREVDVDLKDVFANFVITELQEMSVGANMKLEDDVRFEWSKSADIDDLFGCLNINNRLERDPHDLIITLAPMQIRTFLAKIK